MRKTIITVNVSDIKQFLPEKINKCFEECYPDCKITATHMFFIEVIGKYLGLDKDGKDNFLELLFDLTDNDSQLTVDDSEVHFERWRSDTAQGGIRTGVSDSNGWFLAELLARHANAPKKEVEALCEISLKKTREELNSLFLSK